MTRQNLFTEIESTARRRGARGYVRFLGSGDEASYEEVLRASEGLAVRFPAPGGRPPDAVVIAASEPLPTLLAFFAALRVDAKPLILPAPKALGGLDAFLERARRAVGQFRGRCVIAVQERLLPEGTRLPDAPIVPLPLRLGAYRTDTDVALPPPRRGGGDVAFLQCTSASTGDGKLVAITHANVLANLAAMRTALGCGEEERGMSWLPLYHDMGLVGAALVCFRYGYPMYLMSPTDFVKRPGSWLRTISEFRCSMTAAPSFAFDYAQLVPEKDIAGLDLTSLRVVVVGAEPIRRTALQGFTDRFAPYGFRPDSFAPSYGMAESTLASTMSRPGRPPRYVLVEPGNMASGCPVRVVGGGVVGAGAEPPDQGRSVAVFALGAAVPGLRFDLLDDDGRSVAGDEVLGEVTLRGSSVAAGYLDADSGVPSPFPAAGLPTGDLGFRSGGELFILERKKQVIIRRGQNFLASLIEEQVARILAKHPHELIVLDTDIHDPDSGIAAVVENVPPGADLLPEQAAALRGLDLPIDEVLFAARRAIPRTSSGKKRYHLCRSQLGAQALPIFRTVRPADRI
jgi:fatty-acyl-CoA synthase